MLAYDHEAKRSNIVKNLNLNAGISVEIVPDSVSRVVNVPSKQHTPYQREWADPTCCEW